MAFLFSTPTLLVRSTRARITAASKGRRRSHGSAGLVHRHRCTSRRGETDLAATRSGSAQFAFSREALMRLVGAPDAILVLAVAFGQLTT